MHLLYMSWALDQDHTEHRSMRPLCSVQNDEREEVEATSLT